MTKQKEGYKLSVWIANQRRFYRRGILDKQRINLLNRIGLQWDIWRTYIDVKQEYEKCGFTLLSEEYNGPKEPLKCQSNYVSYADVE